MEMISMNEEKSPHKFKNKFEISYEDFMVGRFQPMVGITRKLISELGEEKALQLVSEFIEEISIMQTKKTVEKNPVENFSQFKEVFKKQMTSEFMKNSSSFTIVEDSDEKLEFNFSECLWAESMKKLGFDGEKGYKICCKADFAMATAFHPNVKLTRTKTLMQGHESCNHCYEWEE